MNQHPHEARMVHVSTCYARTSEPIRRHLANRWFSLCNTSFCIHRASESFVFNKRCELFHNVMMIHSTRAQIVPILFCLPQGCAPRGASLRPSHMLWPSRTTTPLTRRSRLEWLLTFVLSLAQTLRRMPSAGFPF